jgi:hypothetical protein
MEGLFQDQGNLNYDLALIRLNSKYILFNKIAESRPPCSAMAAWSHERGLSYRFAFLAIPDECQKNPIFNNLATYGKTHKILGTSHLLVSGTIAL